MSKTFIIVKIEDSESVHTSPYSVIINDSLGEVMISHQRGMVVVRDGFSDDKEEDFRNPNAQLVVSRIKCLNPLIAEHINEIEQSIKKSQVLAGEIKSAQSMKAVSSLKKRCCDCLKCKIGQVSWERNINFCISYDNSSLKEEAKYYFATNYYKKVLNEAMVDILKAKPNYQERVAELKEEVKKTKELLSARERLVYDKEHKNQSRNWAIFFLLLTIFAAAIAAFAPFASAIALPGIVNSFLLPTLSLGNFVTAPIATLAGGLAGLIGLTGLAICYCGYLSCRASYDEAQKKWESQLNEYNDQKNNSQNNELESNSITQQNSVLPPLTPALSANSHDSASNNSNNSKKEISPLPDNHQLEIRSNNSNSLPPTNTTLVELRSISISAQQNYNQADL